jgi:nucleotide sugar dehydrogenase
LIVIIALIFSLIKNACETAAKIIKKNDIIVIESTVYPGVTEDICVPIIEKFSSLKLNIDFSIGYSPERINPADKKYKFENIKKVISASNYEALAKMDEVYGSVVKAGIYRASSIKVAEAAKVIENTQRDLNIAFMNELVKIFDALKINTHEVLDAASTKWNFLPFQPGFVGGHCIGVDPYYLIHKSQQAGVIPDLLISVRKINDGMSKYFSQRILKILNEKKITLVKSNILLLGLSFKENCPDIRNSKIFNLYDEKTSFNINVEIFDPSCKFTMK